MMGWLKKKMKSNLRRYISSVMQDEIEQFITIADQVRDYNISEEYERQKFYDNTRDPLVLKKELASANVPVEDALIDISDFEAWLNDFRDLSKFYSGFVGHIEKCLEHYLAFKWLNFTHDDIYIDIAAGNSIWADILGKRNILSYKLDLSYPHGIHGRKIGADAGNIILPDGFANSMSLQCAFETFRDDADVRFIHEARRILKDNGRFAIIPLYIDEIYYIMSSPYADLSRIPIDMGAIRVWREDSNKEPFSRHYSPKAFAERIYTQLDEIKGKVIHFINLDQFQTKYPDQSIYCHFMLYCEK